MFRGAGAEWDFSSLLRCTAGVRRPSQGSSEHRTVSPLHDSRYRDVRYANSDARMMNSAAMAMLAATAIAIAVRP
jgi:hypothetical protein